MALVSVRSCCQATLVRFFDNFEAASKRLSRLLHNARLDPDALARSHAQAMCARLPLVGMVRLSLDWTSEEAQHLLIASLRVGRRAVPLYWRAYHDSESSASDVVDGVVFRAVNKGDHVVGEGITPQAIYSIIVSYAEELKSKGVAPHDLRRTFAKLAHEGGAAIDQIQLFLGHESIQTTEDYLGIEKDLTDAPCDRLGLRLT